ncbi:hypothetical protein [Parasitella parasitica]|uniref:Uncharacterized protein n=1 Tax=Parasitella parasitica TaxID=35722 RepID=A0A0B7NMQ7_9FUNG|nr:hypothetical protein [Parasitella parasitica]
MKLSVKQIEELETQHISVPTGEARRRNAEYQRTYRERRRARTQGEQEEEQNVTETDNDESDLNNNGSHGQKMWSMAHRMATAVAIKKSHETRRDQRLATGERQHD